MMPLTIVDFEFSKNALWIADKDAQSGEKRLFHYYFHLLGTERMEFSPNKVLEPFKSKQILDTRISSYYNPFTGFEKYG
jgi:hypothetical protein